MQWGQDTVQAGTFWGVLNISFCASSWFVLTDPLEEVKIFGVSRRVPTDLHEETVIFGVSRGVLALLNRTGRH